MNGAPVQPRVAVVTGSHHGIGAAIAAMLVSEGITVHGFDKDEVDVTDSSAVNSFMARIGSVDILVNNAGGSLAQTYRPLEDVSDDDWRVIVDANLTGTFHCTRAVVPAMKRKGWGRIVNISSGAGRSVSMTRVQAYASAKAAQIGFTRQTAHELGQFGITVNCIAPGFILSSAHTIRQWEGYGTEGQARVIQEIAMRTLGQPNDIANGVRFFVSEESSWVTGQTISIDGGRAIF
jgi:3-oxoacyl-[acyl-carrier protein] reductase